jgi:PAS domain S-box-containing protein
MPGSFVGVLANTRRMIGLVTNRCVVHASGAAVRNTGPVPEDSTDLLAAAFGHAATSLSLADVHGRIVLANEEFWNLFGYEAGTALDVGMISRPADQDWALSYLTRLIIGDIDEFRTVKHYVRKDGTEFDGHLAIRAIRPEGICTGLIASIEPVDVRPIAHDVLVGKLLEHAAGAVSLINPEGDIIETSGRYRSTLGYPIEFWEDRSIFDVMLAEDLPALLDLRDRLLREPEHPVTTDFRVQGANRIIETIEVTARNMLHDPDLNGIVASTRNVTAERQMMDSVAQLRDKAVAEAERRSDLLATVSHELRNPLHAMSGLVELLALDTGLGDDQRELAGSVLRQLKVLTSVTDDLLDTAQMEFGRFGIRPGPVVVRNLIDDVMQVAKSAAGGSIAVVHEVADEVPYLIATDALRVQQILSNLVGNAVKFTEEGSVHLLASVVDGEMLASDDGEMLASDDGKMLQFEVRDTGVGIPREQFDAIFEPFSTATTSGDNRGAGLGLAVVLRLVEALGGNVSTRSVVGQGSVFTVEIPLVDAVAELPDIPTDVVGAVGRASILVVEDTPVNQQLARHQLERLGMDCVSADSAETCLDLLDSSSFDAILMDHQLPGMNGRDATREIRRRGFLMPIVGMTASSTAADERACLEAGMDAFLAKPVGLDRLRTTVRHVLQGGANAARSSSHPSTSTSTAVDTVAVDESVLNELAAELSDRAVVESLVATFLGELAARGADIATGDPDLAARQAHTLKSSAKLLGALQLAELCAAVEIDSSLRDGISEAVVDARAGLTAWLSATPQHPDQIPMDQAK